ncbi:MAG: hypothetical protein LRY63_14705 [Nitrincola sp.]|nr:hypothetical protein [Nitrincola sp.]
MGSVLKLGKAKKVETSALLEEWVELNQSLMERWDKVLKRPEVREKSGLCYVYSGG